MDVKDMTDAAMKAAAESKGTWDEAKLYERGRILKKLGPLFHCLDAAPVMVQATFAACLRDVLALKPSASTKAVQDALVELGFQPKD